VIDCAHELTRAEESQAIALIPALVERIEHLTGIVESMAERLPPILEPAAVTAKRIHCDVRTLTTRHPEGVVRVGRRLLFNPSVLLPKSAAEIAQLARSART
jgi:hypothetical protein